MKVQLAILVAIAAFPNVFALKRCGLVDSTPDPIYHLIKPCSRSKMILVGSANTRTLQQCQRFATSKRALSLNYNPSGDFQEEPSCHVFDCPEFQDQISLVEDDVYDYYSLYADPLPDSNVSCVPKLGMFKLHREKTNFTAAQEICDDEGGYLANVLSELRTNALSDLIGSVFSGRGKHAVYVGLHDSVMEGQYVNMRDEPLDCFNWRAWAPNQPRSKYSTEDCVVLTTDKNWKVINCTQEMPFLCELHPRGPYNLCEEEPAYCQLTDGSPAVPSAPVDTSSSQPDEQVGTDIPDIVEIPLPGVSDANSTDEGILTIDIKNISDSTSTKKPSQDGNLLGDNKPVEEAGKPDSQGNNLGETSPTGNNETLSNALANETGETFKPGLNSGSSQKPWRPSLGTNAGNGGTGYWKPTIGGGIDKPEDGWTPMGNSNKTNNDPYKKPILVNNWTPGNSSSNVGNKSVLWRPKNPETKDPEINSEQALWKPHHINLPPVEERPPEGFDINNNWQSDNQTHIPGVGGIERPPSTNAQSENNWRPTHSNSPENTENKYNSGQNYWTPFTGNREVYNTNQQNWNPENTGESYNNEETWSPNNYDQHGCNEWMSDGHGVHGLDDNNQWNPVYNSDQNKRECNQNRWEPHDEERTNNEGVEENRAEVTNNGAEETPEYQQNKFSDRFHMEGESRTTYRQSKAPRNTKAEQLEARNQTEENKKDKIAENEGNINQTKVEEKLPLVTVKVRDPSTQKCRAVTYDPN